MIEKYNNIKIFIPNAFKILSDKEDRLKQNLQDFVNFICNENHINSIYKLDITNFSSDLENINSNASFSHIDHKIKINKLLFNQYIDYIQGKLPYPDENGQKRDLTSEEIDYLEAYPYRLCSDIVHECEHIRQYEKHLETLNTKEQNNIENYPNYEIRISKDPLYGLQTEEIDARKVEINEMEKLKEYFSTLNIDMKLIDNTINGLKNDDKYYYDNSLKDLKNKGLLKTSIKNITPENYKQNIKLFNEVQEIIKREIEFVKDFQDFIINESEFIKGNINLKVKGLTGQPKDEQLTYYIRNDNDKWNVVLRSNLNEIRFSLQENTCNINTMAHHFDSNYESENPRKLDEIDEKNIFKYMNAIICLYNKEINTIRFSDFIYASKKETKKYIKEHSTSFFNKNKFSLKLKNISEEEYKDSYNALSKSLSMDEIIQLKTVDSNNKFVYKELSFEK